MILVFLATATVSCLLTLAPSLVFSIKLAEREREERKIERSRERARVRERFRILERENE